MGKAMGQCFLFKCYYKQGGRIYGFSMFWLGSLLKQAGGCIQHWRELWISFGCPGLVGKTALKQVMLFACYLNSSWPMPQVAWLNRSTGFVLQTTGSLCPSYSLCTTGLQSFHMFLPPHQMGLGATAGRVISILSCLYRKGRCYSFNSQFPKQAVWMKRTWKYPQPWFWINSSAYVWQENSPASFTLGFISSTNLHLGLSIAGLHSFQVFSPAPLGRCGWEISSTVGGAVTQLPGKAWAYQAIVLAKLLVWGSEPGRSAPHQVPCPQCTDMFLQIS